MISNSRDGYLRTNGKTFTFLASRPSRDFNFSLTYSTPADDDERAGSSLARIQLRLITLINIRRTHSEMRVPDDAYIPARRRVN